LKFKASIKLDNIIPKMISNWSWDKIADGLVRS
jgi:hypothetical protein